MSINKLKHFQRFQATYASLMLMGYLLINNSINASTVIMEKQRLGPLPFKIWEPFVWEYSSAISTLFCFFCLIFCLNKYPPSWQQPLKTIFVYFIFSICYCALHVMGMVVIRELIYTILQHEYNFNLSTFELVYEYQKDAWTFIQLIILVYVYRYVISNVQGEAKFIAESANHKAPKSTQKLIVKKLGKEYLITINDIEWLEASGNYVNLHITSQVYPIRSTMTNLVKELPNQKFCRIHRSYAVNLAYIKSIQPLNSGDSKIELKNNELLPLSRHYSKDFKGLFEAY